MVKLVQSRDEINPNPAKVGQAVYDILSKEQDEVTVQEILEESADDFTKHLIETIEANANRFEPPFYVVVLTKKEFWATNVMRNWFVARQTKPVAAQMRHDYPNYQHLVYSYDKSSSQLKLLWCMPTKQDADTIMKNFSLYHPTLVEWCKNIDIL